MAGENKTYCMECFSVIPEGEVSCPRCGWTDAGQEPDALPFGTVLDGRYLIGQAVRRNGVGITYAAFERAGNRKVEVREFFPENIAFRDPNGVAVKAGAGAELLFADYLNEFERYTQKLKALSGLRDFPAVIGLLSANGTLYAVVEYTDSVSLRSYVEENGPLPWNECEALFLPMIRSLSAMSSRDVDHLGISPDTLRVTDGGRLILCDFEIPAARRAGTDIVEDIFPGCWALEQYSRTKICDEVTDVYGLCASLFFALSGAAPTEAPKRRQDPRLMIDRSVIRTLPNHVVAAIANGLQVDVERRTSSFSRLLAELTAAPKVVSRVQEIETTRALPTGKRRRPHAHSLPLFIWLVLSFAVTLGGLFLLSVTWFKDSAYSPKNLMKTFRGEVDPQSASQIELPNFAGMTVEEVTALGETDDDYDVELDIDEKPSETVPEGEIIEQYPTAGLPVQKGSLVRVTVSSGSARKELPEVAGLSYEAAEAQLLEAGFMPVRRNVASDSVETGCVIGYWEGHEAGEPFPKGAAVQLLVSGEEAPEE